METCSCGCGHPSRRRADARILRACESFDFGLLRHESNQGLTTRKNAETRKDSQTLRSVRSTRLEGWKHALAVAAILRDAALTRGSSEPVNLLILAFCDMSQIKDLRPAKM